MSKKITILTLAAAIIQSRAQVPAPLVGDWTGTFSTAFALADATNPASWECLPNAATITGAHTLQVAPYDWIDGATTAVSQRVGIATYTYPASDATEYVVSAYDAETGILYLADPETPAITHCQFVQINGEGEDRILTVITIGGDEFTWEEQCDPASYAEYLGPLALEAVPFCHPGATGPVAYGSSIVSQYMLTSAVEDPEEDDPVIVDPIPTGLATPTPVVVEATPSSSPTRDPPATVESTATPRTDPIVGDPSEGDGVTATVVTASAAFVVAAGVANLAMAGRG